MIFDWKKIAFQELYLIPSKNGLNRPSAVRGKGYKMLNMGEIFGNDRIYDIDMELVELSVQEKKSFQLLENDLVFARQSIVAEGAGKCSIVLAVSEMTCFESHIIRVRLNQEKATPLFYYYFFQSDLGKGFLGSIRQQGVQAGIRGTDLAKAKIIVPELETQKKIAAILSAYDDLIENNLKRIKLLEEMAQITYEEWFVRLKFPGHETTPLDSATGLPVGWISWCLGDHISVKHGYAYKGEHFRDEETSRVLFTPGNFKIGGGVKLDKLKYYDEQAENPKEYVLGSHDLLITMTDLSKSADTLGYPLLVPSSKEKTYLHNQRLGKVLPVNNSYFPKYFYYMLFQDERYRAFIVGSSAGATVKHTSPSKMLAFKPKLPPIDSDIIKKFDDYVVVPEKPITS